MVPQTFDIISREFKRVNHPIDIQYSILVNLTGANKPLLTSPGKGFHILEIFLLFGKQNLFLLKFGFKFQSLVMNQVELVFVASKISDGGSC